VAEKSKVEGAASAEGLLAAIAHAEGKRARKSQTVCELGSLFFFL
jgi:hypothetical protein